MLLNHVLTGPQHNTSTLMVKEPRLCPVMMSQDPHIPRIQESKARETEALPGRGSSCNWRTMAANRGARTFLSVFLLCCWQVTELHPVKTTSGRFRGQKPPAWKPQRERSSCAPFLRWNSGRWREGKGSPPLNTSHAGMPGSSHFLLA